MNDIASKWLKKLLYDRRLRMLVIAGAVGIVALHSLISPWFQTSIAGQAQVRDGDSLEIGRHRVRLKGIDAPEQSQTCMRRGRSWACGQAAQDYLAQLIGGQPVVCRVSERDRYGRHLARCHVGDVNLNQKMVSDGMAVAFGGRYRLEEQHAREQRLGMWAGEFQRPQIWRRENPRR